jgi:hypothetical protein
MLVEHRRINIKGIIMNAKFLSSFAIGVALSTAALSAHATPITYTLTNVKFADGATASGSFVFDSVTHLSSAFDISTTPGTLTAFEWTKANSGLYYGGGAGPNNFTLITTNGSRVFNFSFLNPFTDAGGTNVINIASTYECYNCSPFRRVTSGSVTSNAVPEPATLALMLPALGALVVGARRRSASPA